MLQAIKEEFQEKCLVNHLQILPGMPDGNLLEIPVGISPGIFTRIPPAIACMFLLAIYLSTLPPRNISKNV